MSHTMQIDNGAVVVPQTATAPNPDLYQQLGVITRQLHESLTHLDVMTQLQVAAGGLPDARSRLDYIARKSGESAEKVLNSVDQAKFEHQRIADATRALAASLAADPARAMASGAVMNYVGDVEGATARIDAHLTDIMMAQDFHDLTGQVVAKVVVLATDLETSLLKLLVRAAPAEYAHRAETASLQGPVVAPAGRGDVVQNQGEVDDLLASLGF